MNLMTIENISKSYSVKTLLKNISFGISEGEKIGIIGVNGTGKSTLLKIIAGIETPETGKITKGTRVRIEYLSQNPDFHEEATVLEQVFKGNSPEMKLLRDYQEILEVLQKEYNDEINERLLKLQDQIDRLNLWDLESEAKSVLTKLGITNFSQKVKELSGGQRKRVALASALITPCELLILDEPTNHLDNETISKLEEYLNGRKGSLLMITHDRYFLDRVTNRIIELDKGNLYSYDGNYSLFLEKKMERLQLEAAMEDKRQNLLRKELAWVRRGAQARSTKQKARLQRFDELKNQEKPTSQEQLDISVASTRLGRKIIEFNHVFKSYEKRCLIHDLDYTLARTDRIGIVGPNGAGKSTLINLIRGKIKPDSGSIDIGETVKIGCFAQESEEMKPTMRAIDYIKEKREYIETADGTRITASQMCERFLFDGHLQYSQIGTLSGGERRRLYLLRILMDAPNVLLLDEPTNDLDIDTLRRLEDYLDEFNGIVITVSHDRYFLDRICNKIFAYEGKGHINIYTGNYSDYLAFREVKTLTQEMNPDEVKMKETPKAKPRLEKKVKFTFAEQKEFESIDDEIATLEEKVSELDTQLVKYATDYVKLQEIMTEKTEVEEMLNHKYERWEYLNQLAEEIENSKK
ncbi:MAG: ABC-F family ATP-binding cassette domain-containing protein [Turicibacter sp.]|nr:ABC-F family ATP-binding cassette domain-containing protein [Turicibacter sp.]